MTHNIYIYIACMAGITYLIRVIPLTLLRKEIKNKTIRSFLYYVPYVTLAVMTFPSILSATESPLAAALALAVLLTAQDARLPKPSEKLLAAAQGLDDVVIDATFDPESRSLRVIQEMKLVNRTGGTLTAAVLRTRDEVSPMEPRVKISSSLPGCPPAAACMVTSPGFLCSASKMPS